MRVIIKSVYTYIIGKNGGYILETEEEREKLRIDAQKKSDENAVNNAIHSYKQFLDIEPLLKVMLDKNPEFLMNEEALNIIASAARRERLHGRKGRIRTTESIERDRNINLACYYLKKLGMPVKSASKLDICKVIGRRINLSESSIYGIVKPDFVPCELISMFKFCPESLTLENVLDHYFPSKEEDLFEKIIKRIAQKAKNAAKAARAKKRGFFSS